VVTSKRLCHIFALELIKKTMGKFRQLSHVFYKCEYHVVFTPKYRFRILTGTLKLQVEQDIRAICQWREVEVEELSVQQDHVHLVCSIPPKYSISEVLGTLKGKIAMRIFKSYPDLKRKPYWGNHFWVRGYFISTVGLDADMIKRYVKHQEHEEKKSEGF
jgi:putative transposase